MFSECSYSLSIHIPEKSVSSPLFNFGPDTRSDQSGVSERKLDVRILVLLISRPLLLLLNLYPEKHSLLHYFLLFCPFVITSVIQRIAWHWLNDKEAPMMKCFSFICCFCFCDNTSRTFLTAITLIQSPWCMHCVQYFGQKAMFIPSSPFILCFLWSFYKNPSTFPLPNNVFFAYNCSVRE
jgi:hypothetical protein